MCTNYHLLRLVKVKASLPFAVAMLLGLILSATPAQAFWVSCSSLGHEGCTVEEWCAGGWSNCSVTVNIACEQQCQPVNDPYGGFDEGSQDCPTTSTRPTCCGAKRTECNTWCSDTYEQPGDVDNCTWSVCHAEYSSCLSDGYFAGF